MNLIGTPFVYITYLGTHIYKSFNLEWMAQNVTTLCQAYYFTGNEVYASRAVWVLTTWFLNNETSVC